MAKKIAILFGVVFVIVGALGFVPNALVGMGGIFETNMVHDLVHVLFGLILLGVAFGAPAKSALWLKILGVVYLLIAVLGFLMVPDGGELLGLVHTNMNDHILHVILGIVLLGAGFMPMGAKPMATAMPSTPTPPSAPMGGGTM